MPLETLNPHQEQAVIHGLQHDRPAPLLILAGAGTGKTATLAERVLRLVLSGVQPNRLMLLTFSRRAAAELTDRCRQHLRNHHGASSSFRLPWAGTFHSVGYKLIREHAPLLALEPEFTVLDRADAADLMDSVRTEHGLSQLEKRFPRKDTLLAIYSQCINRQADLQSVLQTWFPWCAAWQHELRQLFKAYVQAKAEYQSLDYDDLLLYWHRLMQEPYIARGLSDRFDHVLIDEYQDTNRLQADIVRMLKPDGTGVTAVGDDGQAIYGFRGATVEHILSFPTQFATPARVIRIETNYRCTQPILDAANALMAESQKTYPKSLRSADPAPADKPRLVTILDEASQASFVCEEVLRNRELGVPLKRQAVLFRAAHHSDILEVELKRRNIPFVKHGGLKFLESAHVKDFLALLKWGNNPKDKLGALRVLQLIQGVGPTTAEQHFQALTAANGEFSCMLDKSGSGSRTALDLASLWSLLSKLKQHPGDDWLTTLDWVIDWLASRHRDLYENADVRHKDLLCLASLASHHASLQEFVVSLTLDPPVATGDLAGDPLLDEDYLILSTVHSAKGQEWDQVFVIQVADGNFPSEYATGNADLLEEERRLMYVAMTRAKRGLTLTRPLRYYVPEQPRYGDKHVYGAHSRFLTDKVRACFRESAWPEGQAVRPSSTAALTAEPLIDIRKELSNMW